MIVATAEIRLYAPWVHSLKEKRMLVKSLLARVQNEFKISIAEVAEQDVWQTVVLGLAVVSGNAAAAGSVLDRALAFIDAHSEAEMVAVEREIR